MRKLTAWLLIVAALPVIVASITARYLYEMASLGWRLGEAFIDSVFDE